MRSRPYPSDSAPYDMLPILWLGMLVSARQAIALALPTALPVPSNVRANSALVADSAQATLSTRDWTIALPTAQQPKPCSECLSMRVATPIPR